MARYSWTKAELMKGAYDLGKTLMTLAEKCEGTRGRDENCVLGRGVKKIAEKKRKAPRNANLPRPKGRILFKFFWRVLQAWILHLDILEKCIERGSNATIRILGAAF